jgi:hypothetical protein
MRATSRMRATAGRTACRGADWGKRAVAAAQVNGFRSFHAGVVGLNTEQSLGVFSSQEKFWYASLEIPFCFQGRSGQLMHPCDVSTQGARLQSDNLIPSQMRMWSTEILVEAGQSVTPSHRFRSDWLISLVYHVLAGRTVL